MLQSHETREAHKPDDDRTDVLSVLKWNFFANVIIMLQLVGLSFRSTILLSCRLRFHESNSQLHHSLINLIRPPDRIIFQILLIVL